MAKVIGIDLGTTNSCVAVMEGGEAVIIPNSEGARTTPSVVGFKDGERLVGGIAKRQSVANPENTVMSVKRDMGGNKKFKLGGKDYTAPEVSAMILSKMKADAETYLGTKVTEAVITVPAYFSDAQRQATKDAGRIAGLEVKRIINEPTAAALAYGLNKAQDMNQKILIYDLGGGTFDISILEIGDGVFEVIATAGDNRLGGDDFDNRIIDYVADMFKRENNVDLRNEKMSMQRLREAAEKAKIDLSGVQRTNISLPFICQGPGGSPLNLDYEISRAKFDSLTQDLVEKTLKLTRQALSDAGFATKDVSKVILVGGSTRIPAVYDAVKNLTGKEPFKGINPDECVALGAAIQAGVLAGDVKDVLLLDVTPLSLGIETMGGIFTRLIEKNTTIPTKKSQVFSTASDNQPSVDVHILQGEREMAANNKTLGRFELVGIPPAPRGVPKIEVTFDIDANGIVHVSARDQGTGKEQRVTITASSNLTEQEIKNAVADAEKYAEEDKKRKELIEMRNNADTLVFQIDKFLKENGDKISDEEKEQLTAETDKVKEAIKGDDTDAIKEATDSLQKISSEIFTKMYQQHGGAPEGGQGQEGGPETIHPENADNDSPDNGEPN